MSIGVAAFVEVKEVLIGGHSEQEFLAMTNKIKKGTVRADGKIFWAYKYQGKEKFEKWLTPEQFAKWEAGRIAYAKRKRAEYKAQQAALPPEQRNVMGRQDPITGLYFIQVLTNGSPQFGTLEQLNAHREKVRNRSKNYHTKCQSQYPKSTLCIGDKHPENPDLVVYRIWGNKIFYSTPEKLEQRKQAERESDAIYREKNREKINKRRADAKRKVMESLKANSELKMKRGYINPVTKQVFWVYDASGREVWLNRDEFDRRRNAGCLKRKMHREARKNNHAQN